MSEWKEYKLGEIAAPVRDKIETSSLDSFSYISTENMLPNKAGVTQSSGIPSGNAVKFKKEDILISNIRPYFKKIWRADKIGGCSADVICLRASESVDPLFLYYLLCQDLFFSYVMQGSKGTKMPRGDRNQIMQWSVKIPCFDSQQNIASILSSLDDKIAVNKKICENLEAQAQALFKHWFVDFAPFKDGKFVESELGLIPEGWRVCTLEEICKCELGGTPSRAKKSYWGGNIAWINSGEVNKFRICEASEFITEDGLNHSATKLLPAKTTVLAITGATLGQVSLLEIDSCANQSVVGVKENETIPYTFIYPAIKCNINKLVNMQTGGAQQHINKDNIQSLQIIEAPKNIMEEYKLLTLPLYEEIGILCFENLRLATLRDTLLPKLMSGQIKMNEIAL